MLARALVAALAIECAALLWLGAAIARTAGFGTALATVIAVALGWRLVLVALTYLVAFLTPGHEAEITAAGPVALGLGFLGEWAAFTVLFAAVQPFVRWTMGPPDRAFGPDDGRPVLLVHGYLCNRGFWFILARRLGRAGYRVYTIDLEPVFGGIDAFARQLDERVGKVREAVGGRAIALVGHSMGGLVIRAWLRDHDGRGIAGAVTLGTPHHGTSLAWLGLGSNAMQMRLRSRWLSELSAPEPRPGYPPLTSVFSGEDNFISPQASARLEWATNVPLEGVGHLAMAFSGEIRSRLVGALAPVHARA